MTTFLAIIGALTPELLIKLGGLVLSVYEGIKGIAASKGLAPDTFDAQVKIEKARLDGWAAGVASIGEAVTK